MPSLIPDAAAFEKRLAGLPVEKHPAREVVLTAGSKTGRLFFLKSGAVEVIKDGVQIASVSAPGSVFDRLLAKFFDGGRDARTLAFIGQTG